MSARARIATLCVLVLLLGGLGTLGNGTAGAQSTPLRVLILGDSYSAGNGTGESYFGPDGCFRSHKNWGAKTAAAIAAGQGRSVSVTNRACSGGVTADITQSRYMDSFEAGLDNWAWHASYDSAVARAKTWCASKQRTGADYADEFLTAGNPPTVSKGLGFYAPRCSRWLRPQVNAVNASYDLVLLTIGGNDAGFGKIGQYCLTQELGPFTRNANKCRAALSGVEQFIARGDSHGYRGKLNTVLSNIMSRLNPASRTKLGTVALLTYPYLIRNNGYSFDGIQVGSRLKAASDQGEARQRDQISLMDFPTSPNGCGAPAAILADGTKAAFSGHEPFATIGFTSSDDTWLWHLTLPVSETMHPKPAGHVAEAGVMVDALRNAGFGQGCA